MTCAHCGRELTRDETGISRKLINRATQVFYCLDCLSVEYSTDRQTLEDMIERFRRAGCTLFT